MDTKFFSIILEYWLRSRLVITLPLPSGFDTHELLIAFVEAALRDGMLSLAQGVLGIAYCWLSAMGILLAAFVASAPNNGMLSLAQEVLGIAYCWRSAMGTGRTVHCVCGGRATWWHTVFGPGDYWELNSCRRFVWDLLGVASAFYTTAHLPKLRVGLIAYI